MSDLAGTITELVRVAIARKLYEGTAVDLAICRHESAHALAAWSTRAPAIREVFVDYSGAGALDNHAPKPEGTPAEPRSAILERLRREHPAELRAVLSRQIVTLFAGRAADEHPGSEYRRDPSTSQSDMDEADFLAEAAVGRDEVGRFLAPLRAAALSLVTDGWPVICELATLLCDERRLPGGFVETWLSERGATRSLQDHWSAVFASPVPIDKPSSAGVLPGERGTGSPASPPVGAGEHSYARERLRPGS